jgi:cell division inhibitor SulA
MKRIYSEAAITATVSSTSTVHRDQRAAAILVILTPIVKQRLRQASWSLRVTDQKQPPEHLLKGHWLV